MMPSLPAVRKIFLFEFLSTCRGTLQIQPIVEIGPFYGIVDSFKLMLQKVPLQIFKAILNMLLTCPNPCN